MCTQKKYKNKIKSYEVTKEYDYDKCITYYVLFNKKGQLI